MGATTLMEDNLQSANHNKLEPSLLMGVLVALALQILNVQLFSAFNILEYSWMVSVVVLIGLLVFVVQRLKVSGPEVLGEVTVPWRSIWPWLFVALLLIQIAVYPPTMNDSLAYRLPRIFMALQEGSLSAVYSPDERMMIMPWGWESLAMPFASVNGIGWSRLVNLGAWMLVYHLLTNITFHAGASAGRSRLFALGVSTAPFFLLQASSTANDIFAAAMLMSSAWLMIRFKDDCSGVNVLGSLLALILASSAKPQFLTLALPWLAWWLFASGKPWKRVSWWVLAVACPFYLLVSPLPQMIMQYLEYGSLSGEPKSVTETAGPFQMMLAGSIQFSVIQLQLPVFPGNGSFNDLIRSMPGMDALGKGIPKFAPGVGIMPIIDNASVGLLHTFLLVVICLAAVRYDRKRTLLYIGAVLLAFLIASSQIVVSTMGRSFAGYLLLLAPIASFGAAKLMNHKFFRAYIILVIAAGMGSLIINPSAPLWPAKLLQSKLEKSGKKRIAVQVDQYLSYQGRALTGEGILDQVPEGKAVGVLIRPVTPVAALWQPDWRSHRIWYVDQTNPRDFAEGECEWLLLAGFAAEAFPELAEQYQNLPGWEIVTEREYLPNISQGYDTWTLYHRVNHSD